MTNGLDLAVCKIGQGEKCCRYLVASPKGFGCVKHIPRLKNILDKCVEAGEMNARGDNCEGVA